MLRLFFLFALSFLVACGGDSHHDENNSDAKESCNWLGMTAKIVNGAACDDSRSPVVRVILSDGKDKYLCSGVLIDSSTVLTAAHCLSETIRSAYVSYGKMSKTQKVDAMQWFVYPQYKGYGPEGDVAIIKLRLNILNWPTIPLLFSRTAQEGETGTIFGYGTTGDDSKGNIDILRGGYAHVSKANQYYIYMHYTYDSNTCSGDSGGPLILMQNGVAAVVGITSEGSVSGCGYGDNSYFAALQDPNIQFFIKSHASTDARYL